MSISIVTRPAPGLGTGVPLPAIIATILVGLALLASPQQAAAQQIPQDSASKSVAAALQAQWSAQVGRDTAALRNLLGDDIVYIHSNGLVEDKAGFIRTVATGSIVYHDIQPLEMTHWLVGTTVVGNGRVRVRVELGGRDLVLELLVTTVHARRDGRWQLVAWQSTRPQ
ncbi:MAG: nuclear transport factor 2 family protein [Gemmatimonadales bacterium]